VHPNNLVGAARQVLGDAAQRDGWVLELQLAAIGWVTVELERAADELAGLFRDAGLPEPTWSPGTRDELLGATAWVGTPPRSADRSGEYPLLVVLEPDTEGRVAATLTRSAEGVGAVYVSRARGASIDPSRLGRPSPGPLGAARLVLARPTWGPHVVVLDAAPSRGDVLPRGS
jgi:hypothetical protein